MSHTNSTTNYSLPQFVTSDKPAWLTDINNAYSAIDTGMHNAQTKANTADTNASQALLDAASAASAASAADAKGAGAVASLADAFQTTETYSVGDLVIYNNLLYVCSTAVTDPGSWTGSTNWSRVTVEGFVNGKTASDIPLNSSVDAPTTAAAIGAKIPSTSILKANFTADSNSAYGVTLTDTINTTKGVYLIVFSLPVMSITNNFGIQLTGTNFTLYGGSYPSLTPQGTCCWLVNVTSATGTLYVKSADGQACNFTYKERGGLNAFKLVDT